MLATVSTTLPRLDYLKLLKAKKAALIASESIGIQQFLMPTLKI
jgi:hypothetical protein